MSKTIEQRLEEAFRKIDQLEEKVKKLESLSIDQRKALKEHNVYLVHLRKANRKASKTNS